MVLKDIPADARLREKLLASGAGSLANTESIAQVLRTGRDRPPALQLAQQMRDHFGGIRVQFHFPGEVLTQLIGGGEPLSLAERGLL